MKYFHPDFGNYVLSDEAEKSIRIESDRCRKEQVTKGYQFWRQNAWKLAVMYFVLFMFSLLVFVQKSSVIRGEGAIIFSAFGIIWISGAALYFLIWRDAKQKMLAEHI